MTVQLEPPLTGQTGGLAVGSQQLLVASQEDDDMFKRRQASNAQFASWQAQTDKAAAVAVVTPVPPPLLSPEADAGAPGGAVPPGGVAAAAAGAAGNADGVEDLSQYSAPRRLCKRITTNADFEMLVILVIFANCVTLAMYDPLRPEKGPWNGTLGHIELAFNVAFTVEMGLRMVADGGVWANLRQPWNLFDGLMVLAGYLVFIPADSGGGGTNTQGLRAVRAMRALRPLRTITRFESLRGVVVCFMDAVPLLGSVLSLLFFLIFVFAVAALQLFPETFHARCEDLVTGSNEEDKGDDPDMWGCSTNSAPGTRTCPAPLTCVPDATVYNVAGYDNFGLSALTIFQLMTRSGWVYVMYRTMDALHAATAVFYITLQLFGQYYVLSLPLAVLKIKYSKAQAVYKAKRRGRRGKQNSLMSLFSRVKSKVSAFTSQRSAGSMLNAHIGSAMATRMSFMSLEGDIGGGGKGSPAAAAAAGGGGAMADPEYLAVLKAKQQQQQQQQARGVGGGGGGNKSGIGGGSMMGGGGGGIGGIGGVSGSSAGSINLSASQIGGTAAATRMMTVAEFDEFTADAALWKKAYLRSQFRVRALVEHTQFNNLIMVAVVVNTVLLAMEYDGMSAGYELALSNGNLGMTVIFTAELVLKVFGLGIWDYISDGWNIFDALIVALSLLELGLSAGASLNAMRSMRALRVIKALRVLRLFKMFRYLKSLRKISDVLLQSFSSFMSILVLLALFLLVYAIMGLHIFGGIPPDPPNATLNFDTFINSLVTVFNVLTLEDWHINMYAVVRANNWGAAAFYITWVMLGNYVLLSLFLAVTLEAFEAKYDAGNTSFWNTGKSWLSNLKSKVTSAVSSVRSQSGRQSGGSSAGGLPPPQQQTGRRGPMGEAWEGPAGLLAPAPGAAQAARPPTQHAWSDVQLHSDEDEEDEAAHFDEGVLLPSTAQLLERALAAARLRHVAELAAESAAALEGALAAANPEALQQEADELEEEDDQGSSRHGHPPLLALPCTTPTTSMAAMRGPVAEGAEDSRPPALLVPGGPSDATTTAAAAGYSPDWSGSPAGARGMRPITPAGAAAVASAQRRSLNADTGANPPPDPQHASSTSQQQSGAVAISRGGVTASPSHVEALLSYLSGQQPPLPAVTRVNLVGRGSPSRRRASTTQPEPEGPSVDERAAMIKLRSVRPSFDIRRASLDMSRGASDPRARPARGTRWTMMADDDDDSGGPMTDALHAAAMAASGQQQQQQQGGASGPTAPVRRRRVSVLLAGLEEQLGMEPGSLNAGSSGTADGANGGAGKGGVIGAEGSRGDLGRLDSSLSASSLGSDLGEDAEERRRRRKAEKEEAAALAAGGEGRREPHKKRSWRVKDAPPLEGKTFWLLGPDNALRRRVYWLVTNTVFDYTLMAIILLNCVTMALETPKQVPGETLYDILYYSDIVFTAIFTGEMVLKVVAFTGKTYITRITNVIDFVVVTTSILYLALASADVQAVKSLRVLRVIKPLRVLTRSSGMRMVLKSVTLSLAAMANVSIVILLFFLIFAILGVQLFGGLFKYCNDSTMPDQASCTGTYITTGGITAPRAWLNRSLNFDNIGNAFLSLFVVVTLNYISVLENAMATRTEKGLQPIPNKNPAAALFFFAFIIICCFTLLNLYVGVIFNQFTKIRLLSETGSAFLTSDQQEWSEMVKTVFRMKPPDKSPVPEGRLRRGAYHIVLSRPFEWFIMAVIVLNVTFMAATFYNQPDSWTRRQEAANFFFMAVYIGELLLKVAALGPRQFWRSGWNKFDLLLVVSSIPDLVLVALAVDMGGLTGVQKVLRIMRLLRLVRLLKALKGIRALLQTLIISLPAFGNVASLVFLFFFMYAYIGVLVFGQVVYQTTYNQHANFDNMGAALLTLFRVNTGDNWNAIMSELSVRPPACDASLDQCGSAGSAAYFLTFIIVVPTVLFNLFNAIIIENFEKQYDQGDWKLTGANLEQFLDLWAQYDDGSSSIDPHHLEEMLMKLDPPLGLGPNADGKDVLRFVYDLDIPLVAGGRVPFQRTLYELVRRCSATTIPEGILKENLDRLVSKAFKNLVADEVMNFSLSVTALRIQRKWRARMRAAKMKRLRQWRHTRNVAASRLSYKQVLRARQDLLSRFQAMTAADENRWRINLDVAPWAKQMLDRSHQRASRAGGVSAGDTAGMGAARGLASWLRGKVGAGRNPSQVGRSQPPTSPGRQQQGGSGSKAPSDELDRMFAPRYQLQ